jgi:hypothetical protein
MQARALLVEGWCQRAIAVDAARRPVKHDSDASTTSLRASAREVCDGS